MFKPVFRAAQQALREKFGMSLMELPLKERVTVAQKRAAQRAGHATSQAGKQSATNKSWVLVSTLPSALRAATVLGPTRNPNATAEAEYVGLYSFVVSIVYLSQGARISEGKMERYLARCDAGEYVLGGEKIDNVLKKMERQGYIIKVRDREPGGEETIDWILGPRGKVEVGEKGVAGLVKMVYGKKDTEMEDLEDKLERSLGAGTFKRKTSRGGEVDEEEDVEQEGARTRGRGHTNGDADDDNEEGGTQTGRSSRSQTLLAPQARRSTTRRRSNLIDDTAVARDDEEEEEEEEEEDDDDDEEAEDDEDEE